MIQPRHLKKGDTIAIVSTARKITLKEIQPAIDLLLSWELKVVVGKTIGAEDNQFAGSDEDRIEDFQKMLNDISVNAIWCARGGYGTVRIIDQLDFSTFMKNPKWVIGYSDVTVLHSHLHQIGVQSIHGTMPINVSKNTKNSLFSLKNSLFEVKTDDFVKKSIFNKIGDSSGILVGGNLSILYSLMGSSSSINTNGKILFIEDLDEYLYHIDRMMLALKRNNYFKNLKGLVVGGMTQMHDNAVPFGKTAEEIILDNLCDYDFPICFDFPAGHLDDNRTVILGSKVKLNVGETESVLSYDNL